MKRLSCSVVAALSIALGWNWAWAQNDSETPMKVTVDNFVRAESDAAFANVVKDGGFGKFFHNRDVTPIEHQPVIRQNRDTLYSAAVFDLDAGPVTITLPDSGKRFMSMQAIDQDEYTSLVAYKPGTYTLSKSRVSTRYVFVALRTLVNPGTPGDVEEVHRLQDAIRVQQTRAGTFQVPRWDAESQKRVREALLQLGMTLQDTKGMFGPRGHVDPVRHLIGAAMAWGGNPPKDAMYVTVTPEKNDGKTVYKLRVKDVPVDGFWSISVYNKEGYFEKNSQGAYTLNNLTAKRDANGAYDVQFGDCGAGVDNCLPITVGWNYVVRMYRPRSEIVEGKWRFPDAQVVN